MGIFNPVQRSASAFAYSAELCTPIVSFIRSQAVSFDPEELKRDQRMIKDKQDFDLEFQHNQAAARLSAKSPPQLQRALAMARQKGASSWVFVRFVEVASGYW